MLLDGVVYSRKRRDAFNEHALHQTVAPPSHDPEEPRFKSTTVTEASGIGQRSIPLHEAVPGKVVHDLEHDADDRDPPPPSAEGAVDLSTAATGVVEDASPESMTPPSVPLFVNVSATTTNYSHDHSTHTVAVDHLTSSSSVSVDSAHPDSASLYNERSDMIASSPRATREKHIHVVDDEHARSSESSPVTGRNDDIEATTSSSSVKSAKLGADTSGYGNVVDEITGNDSSDFPANYSGNIDTADSVVESSNTVTLYEIHSSEPTSDQQLNVSNSSDELVPVELDQEKVDASTIPPSIVVVDNETEMLDASSDTDGNIVKPVKGVDEIAEDHDSVSKEKISTNESRSILTGSVEASDVVSETINTSNSRTSDIVKETRELPQEYSSSESEASSNVVKVPERSEEFQGDYPIPIYSYVQDEVEIVNLQKKKRPLAEDQMHAAKLDTVSRKERDKDDLRIIIREGSDEEFLRKFEQKFHEASIELDESADDLPLVMSHDNTSPVKPLHEGLHDSLGDASHGFPSNADHLSNSPVTQRVQIVEVPVYHDAHSGASFSSSSSSSSSSSPHRVLINVTIASGDSNAASSRPLYVLSVSVPTEVDGIGRSSGINIEQAQVHAAERPAEPPASMKKIPVNDGESMGAVDMRLPPPPQPPASPPAPIWAGGECECSCPCMGSSSDEWDNFSAIDDDFEEELGRGNSAAVLTEKFPESKGRPATTKGRDRNEESARKNSAGINVTSTTESYYPSSMNDTVENSRTTTGDTTAPSTYEPQVSTDTWACSGTTPLPPEPTILILEGEAPFMTVSL